MAGSTTRSRSSSLCDICDHRVVVSLGWRAHQELSGCDCRCLTVATHHREPDPRLALSGYESAWKWMPYQTAFQGIEGASGFDSALSRTGSSIFRCVRDRCGQYWCCGRPPARRLSRCPDNDWNKVTTMCERLENGTELEVVEQSGRSRARRRPRYFWPSPAL